MKTIIIGILLVLATPFIQAYADEAPRLGYLTQGKMRSCIDNVFLPQNENVCIRKAIQKEHLSSREIMGCAEATSSVGTFEWCLEKFGESEKFVYAADIFYCGQTRWTARGFKKCVRELLLNE